MLVPADHPIQWVTASPLWDAVLPSDSRARAADELLMRRPALLRFASDSFMEDLDRLLRSDPLKLADHRAKPVTYRVLPPGRTAPAKPPELKLFQPAHGHFNLVAATLVCRRAGLPEHLVDAARQERAAFVLRRLDASGDELAWVPGATPAENAWTVPADPSGLVDGEELLPLFGVKFERQGRSRQLFVGLVPTSSAASFRNTGPLSIAATEEDRGGPAPDPRADEVKVKIRRPLEQITDQTAEDELKGEASRFLLVDLGGWLHDHLGADGAAILAGKPPTGTGALKLWDEALSKQADASRTWVEALATAWELRDGIWGEGDQDASGFQINLAGSQPSPAELEAQLVAALPPEPVSPPPRPDGEPGPDETPIPKLDLQGTARYLVRCVYLRPACGALHDDVISAPSEPFKIAGFFDLDAPARPIQIALPVDTSIRDLHKLRKSVRLLLSDELRHQVEKAKDLNKLLKKQTGDDEGPPTLGMICSFSIPIITICALILLMIIVSLLNIIFWWLPFFRICFPISLKGAK